MSSPRATVEALYQLMGVAIVDKDTVREGLSALQRDSQVHA